MESISKHLWKILDSCRGIVFVWVFSFYTLKKKEAISAKFNFLNFSATKGQFTPKMKLVSSAL